MTRPRITCTLWAQPESNFRVDVMNTPQLTPFPWRRLASRPTAPLHTALGPRGAGSGNLSCGSGSLSCGSGRLSCEPLPCGDAVSFTAVLARLEPQVALGRLDRALAHA